MSENTRTIHSLRLAYHIACIIHNDCLRTRGSLPVGTGTLDDVRREAAARAVLKESREAFLAALLPRIVKRKEAHAVSSAAAAAPNSRRPVFKL